MKNGIKFTLIEVSSIGFHFLGKEFHDKVSNALNVLLTEGDRTPDLVIRKLTRYKDVAISSNPQFTLNTEKYEKEISIIKEVFDLVIDSVTISYLISFYSLENPSILTNAYLGMNFKLLNIESKRGETTFTFNARDDKEMGDECVRYVTGESVMFFAGLTDRKGTLNNHV